MGKKAYSKPLVLAEKFIPQNYIAACSPDSQFVTYKFWCNANIGNYGINYSLHVYFDDGDGVFNNRKDTSALPAGWGYSPCGEYHEVTVRKGDSIDDVFPKGWLVPINGYGQEFTNRARAIRIWQPKPVNYNNTHCTFQLDENEFTISNPS